MRNPFGWNLPPGVTDRMIDEAATGGLSDDEWDLLDWLGAEDFSQYGECHGKALDSLVAKGLAQIHEGREQQSGFIAQGDRPMYRAVSLTEDGRSLLEESR